jgi:hypothetical protein
MPDNTLFNQFFPDHKEVFPVIAMLDESADPASLVRAKQAWSEHGECRLDSLSEYLHHTLVSVLGFHNDNINWDGMTFFYIEFGNEQFAREAFIEAQLSEDCVRGALRFTDHDHTVIAHAYRRMESLIQLNQALDEVHSHAKAYNDEMRSDANASACIPDFGVEKVKEHLEAEVQRFDSEVADILNGMKLNGW